MKPVVMEKMKKKKKMNVTLPKLKKVKKTRKGKEKREIKTHQNSDVSRAIVTRTIKNTRPNFTEQCDRT